MYKLSGIMATYNDNPNFLKACVNSILSQTFKDFEFIIVIEPGDKNKGFLENVADADKRVNVLENESRLGLSGSRNRAIKEGCSEYIAFIDGDDYCDIKRFEKQAGFLDNNPDVSAVGSNIYLIDEYDNIIGERRYPELHKDIKRGFLLTMSLANPTVMLRRKDLDEAGLFDIRFSKAEDFELWLRFLTKNKKMYNIQENLVYYRVPARNAEKRPRTHWKNNYISRRMHSKFIWPLYQRFFSLSFFYLASIIPNAFLDNLMSAGFINKIKNIKRN